MYHSHGPAAVADGTTIAEGQVRSVQVQSTYRGENTQSKTVWTFRIERYDDAGNRILLIPVEMRGLTFEGSINDGDWVRTRGRMRSGTLRVTRLENLTTGASVRAKGVSKAAWIVGGLFLLFILAWFAFLAYDGVTHAGAPPGFPGP
ncbi:hypothetical protein [Streptomyces mirabilis]|uniref:hypothetical protein n=1 Tax=Streptomyces mirabilis TaxID=68239 RepID=UPI003812369B